MHKTPDCRSVQLPIASQQKPERKKVPMLPSLNDNFVRYIAPARAKPQLWRLLAGLTFATTFYFVFITTLVVFTSSNGINLFDALNGKAGPLETSVLLFSFFGMGSGIVLAARLFQNRSLMSLLGPSAFQMKRHFIIAATLVFALAVIAQAFVLMGAPTTPNLKFSIWVVWLPSSLVLIFLQTSAEELVFRGYLQQQLAARFSSRWIWWVLPSLLFGMAHYDPETFGPNAWLVVVDTTLFGLIAADLTARTGNLGAAIALHFVNNAMTFLFLAPKDDMNGLALNITSFGVSDFEQMRVALYADLALLLVAYFVYLRIIARRGF
ncbi:MAG: membrane protease YdiL (CAAX protease family) [Paracoccaceae bacterium]|jgi:membrane protease YdiL (CAAX protease family)